MYISTISSTDEPIKVWRVQSDPKSIWFGVIGTASMSVNLAEAQRLIADLQREVAIEEARVRAMAA